MGANMGILPPLPEDQRPRDKRLRYMAVAERAVASFQQWLDENNFCMGSRLALSGALL